MIYCILMFILAIEKVFSTQLQNSANLLSWESCNYGDIVENLCIKCVCTTEGLYNCELRDCEAVKEIYYTKTEACQPNRVYHHGPIRCICTDKGKWPHEVCHDAFKYLPKDSTKKQTCEPQGYVRVDCNICRCNDNGEVDTTRCTDNECKAVKPARKNNEDTKSSLFGQCIVKNWYSLAPCQFCYCVDTNKLMCSTSIVPSSRQGQMNLGPNALTWCGAGLLKEIAALVPSQKFKRLRAMLSSDENSLNNQHATHNENMEIPTIQYLEEFEKIKNNFKALTETKTVQEDAQHDMSDDEEDNKANSNDNKNNPGDVKIDIAASFDGSSRRRNNPLMINYNNLDDAAKKLLNIRRLLSIKSAKNCKPGKPVKVECNICHCLNNGKMLCTNNKCN